MLKELSLEEKIANMRKRTFTLDCIPTESVGRCPAGIPGSDHGRCNMPLGNAPIIKIRTKHRFVDVKVCPRCHSKVLPEL